MALVGTGIYIFLVVAIIASVVIIILEKIKKRNALKEDIENPDPDRLAMQNLNYIKESEEIPEKRLSALNITAKTYLGKKFLIEPKTEYDGMQEKIKQLNIPNLD